MKLKAEIPAWVTANWQVDMLKGNQSEAFKVGQLAYTLSESMQDHGWIKVGRAVIEVEIDLENILDAQIAAIEGKIKTARAEFSKTVMELEAEKAKLLCLEHTPAVDADDFPF